MLADCDAGAARSERNSDCDAGTSRSERRTPKPRPIRGSTSDTRRHLRATVELLDLELENINLFVSALIEAAPENVENVILFTADDNIAPQRAYEALGFARIGEFAVVLFEAPSHLN